MSSASGHQTRTVCPPSRRDPSRFNYYFTAGHTVLLYVLQRAHHYECQTCKVHYLHGCSAACWEETRLFDDRNSLSLFALCHFLQKFLKSNPYQKSPHKRIHPEKVLLGIPLYKFSHASYRPTLLSLTAPHLTYAMPCLSLFAVCILVLTAHASAVVAPDSVPPSWLGNTIRSERRTRSIPDGLSFNVGGLEMSPKLPYKLLTRHSSVHSGTHTGADVISAILRADKNRGRTERPLTRSSHRLRLASSLDSPHLTKTASMLREGDILESHSLAFPGEPEPSSASVMEAVQDVSLGLTGDSCFTMRDCVSDRVCVAINGACRGKYSCNCIPRSPTTCSSTSDCVAGEVCISSDSYPDDYCVSKQYASDTGAVFGEFLLPTATPVFVVVPQVSVSASNIDGGLTADPCTVDEECRGDRTCLSLDKLIECEGRGSCVCFPAVVVRCEYSEECPEGEKCGSSRGADDICLSAAFVEENTDVFESTSAPGMEVSLSPRMESHDAEDELSSSGDPLSSPEIYVPDLFPRGLNGDPCTSSSDCRKYRSCEHLKRSCSAEDGCICSPRKAMNCTENSDCAAGWRCVKMLKRHLCMSQVVITRSGLLGRTVKSHPKSTTV